MRPTTSPARSWVLSKNYACFFTWSWVPYALKAIVWLAITCSVCLGSEEPSAPAATPSTELRKPADLYGDLVHSDLEISSRPASELAASGTRSCHPADTPEGNSAD